MSNFDSLHKRLFEIRLRRMLPLQDLNIITLGKTAMISGCEANTANV